MESAILTVIANYVCDKKCSFCYTQHTNTKNFVKLTPELFALMDNYHTVNIQGGEPTLHPDILKLVAHKNVKSINTHLQVQEDLVESILEVNPGIKFNSSIPVSRRQDNWEQVDYMLKKYKDNMRCLCYTLFLKDYGSVQEQLVYIKENYIGKTSRVDPIFIFEKGDIEYVKSCSDDEKKAIIKVIWELGGSRFFADTLNYGTHHYTGPDTTEIRDFYYDSNKSLDMCKKCRFTFMETFHECQHCIDFYGVHDFTEQVRDNYLDDMKILLEALTEGLTREGYGDL